VPHGCCRWRTEARGGVDCGDPRLALVELREPTERAWSRFPVSSLVRKQLLAGVRYPGAHHCRIRHGWTPRAMLLSFLNSSWLSSTPRRPARAFSYAATEPMPSKTALWHCLGGSMNPCTAPIQPSNSPDQERTVQSITRDDIVQYRTVLDPTREDVA